MLRWKGFVSKWLLMVGLVATASGDDLPIVDVSRQGLTPDRIEVHVGELVRWRAVKGVRIRLEFDPHRDAHEVIERSGEIRAIFRQSGKHWYVASIVGDGHRHSRGVVIVREADQPVPSPVECGPESSPRLCFQP
jgi:plastocyanin